MPLFEFGYELLALIACWPIAAGTALLALILGFVRTWPSAWATAKPSDTPPPWRSRRESGARTIRMLPRPVSLVTSQLSTGLTVRFDVSDQSSESEASHDRARVRIGQLALPVAVERGFKAGLEVLVLGQLDGFLLSLNGLVRLAIHEQRPG